MTAQEAGVWIPAFAGMTVGGGGNDGMGRAGLREMGACLPTVIPAQAGIQNPGQPRRSGGRGVDSRLRGNDGGGGGDDGWRDYGGVGVYPIPSFRRRPESRTPVAAALQHPFILSWSQDERMRGGGNRGFIAGWRITRRSSCDQLRMNGYLRRRVAAAHIPTPAAIAAPIRHSRESGNPHLGLPIRRG